MVLVSGCPGAGKTTLARPLAAELGFALLGKDRIKETLCDGLGVGTVDLALSRQLGAAAMELLWALAADAPDVVLEANFPPRSDYVRAKISGLGGRLVEVHCHCPAELAMARYSARELASHRVHVVKALTARTLAGFDRPVGLGELVSVSTAGPVDMAEVAWLVRERLAAGGAGRTG